MGLIDYIIPQMFKRPLYSAKLAEWQYWLIVVGFLGFFWALTIAGFVQGQSWLRGIPEVNVIPMLRPYFMARAVSGALIVISGLIQAFNIFKTVTTDTRRIVQTEMSEALPEMEVTA
jgi:cbb3-type cytochrome oxidase subunit 1